MLTLEHEFRMSVFFLLNCLPELDWSLTADGLGEAHVSEGSLCVSAEYVMANKVKTFEGLVDAHLDQSQERKHEESREEALLQVEVSGDTRAIFEERIFLDGVLDLLLDDCGCLHVCSHHVVIVIVIPHVVVYDLQVLLIILTLFFLFEVFSGLADRELILLLS